MNKIITSLAIAFSFSFYAQLYTPGSGVTDIDGNTYQTVIINGQEWMSENLRVSKFNNGDLIPVALIDTFENNCLLPFCYSFLGNTNNDIVQGKFYNCGVLTNDRNVCPVNWRIPTEGDIERFTLFIGQNNVSLNDLDSVIIHSLSIENGGTNESGLNLNRGLYDLIYDPNIQDYVLTYDSIPVSLPYYGDELPDIVGYSPNLVEPFANGNYDRIRCVKTPAPIQNIIASIGNGVSDIDGNSYGSVVLGNGQEWMTSNLKTSKLKNGAPIPMHTGSAIGFQSPGWSNYNFSSSNDNLFGKLYNYSTIIIEHQNLCPSGWKVPAAYEWLNLIDYLGGELNAATMLKSTNGWGEVNVIKPESIVWLDSLFVGSCDSIVNLNGTNLSELNIKPGGSLFGSGNSFIGMGDFSLFWSSTMSYYSTQTPGGGGGGGNEGPIGIIVGRFGEVGEDDLCTISGESMCCDTAFNFYIVDTIFYEGDLFKMNINSAFKFGVEDEYRAGYVRCLKQSNGISSTEEIRIEPAFSIFPNPTENILNIELKSLNNDYFTIFDSFGREVKNGELINLKNTISLESVKSGCYFIKLSNYSEVERFIKN